MNHTFQIFQTIFLGTVCCVSASDLGFQVSQSEAMHDDCTVVLVRMHAELHAFCGMFCAWLLVGAVLATCRHTCPLYDIGRVVFCVHTCGGACYEMLAATTCNAAGKGMDLLALLRIGCHVACKQC